MKPLLLKPYSRAARAVAGVSREITRRTLAEAVASGISVRVPTPDGATLLSPADLAFLQDDPGALRTRYGAAITAPQLADQLEGAAGWASQGAQIDLVNGFRHVQLPVRPSLGAGLRGSEHPRVHLRPLLASGATPEDARAYVDAWLDSAAFARMSSDEQSRLARVLTGADDRYCAQVRTALRRLTDSPAYRSLSTKDRAEAALVLLQSWPPNTDAVGAPTGVFEHACAYTISAARPFPEARFASGSADAWQHTVFIEGRTYELLVAKETAPEAGSIYTAEEIARTLASLPRDLRRLIVAVEMSPGRNPYDAFWAERFADPEFRSAASAGDDGVVRLFPPETKVETSRLTTLLVHETAHLLARKSFGATGDLRWREWQSAMRADPLAVSGYARSSQEEDFAETVVLYAAIAGTSEEEQLRRLFPHRFAVLDRLLGAQGPTA